MDKISVIIKTSPLNSIATCIAKNKRHLIHQLKIIGTYQSRYDNDTIRNMCNCTNVDGIRTGGQLEVIDLVDAEIAAEHQVNYITNSGSIRSSNSLHDCLTLREIKFGKSLTHISGEDLSGCLSLEKIDVQHNPIYKSINGILYQHGDNCDWTTPTRTPFHVGKWVLIKVPATIKDSSLIKFDYINQIAPKAFEDTSLESLIMPSIPPICDTNAFSENDISKITLFVPENSYNSYWCHQIWGKFNIQVIKN